MTTTIVASCRFASLMTGMGLLGVAACTGTEADFLESEPEAVEAAVRRPPMTIPLKETKVLIEHNATDLDTGFQIFTDGEPWKSLEVTGPRGAPVLFIEPEGRLKSFGFTELFLETREPANAEVPIPEVLSRLPAGVYRFDSVTTEGVRQSGKTRLSHKIPAGAVLVTRPAEGEVIGTGADVVFAWNGVTTTIDGAAANVEFYQLLVNRVDVPRQKNGFGRNFMEIYVPASVLSMRVPREFLQPNAAYEWEVFAIEANGNQTFVTGFFSTN